MSAAPLPLYIDGDYIVYPNFRVRLTLNAEPVEMTHQGLRVNAATAGYWQFVNGEFRPVLGYVDLEPIDAVWPLPGQARPANPFVQQQQHLQPGHAAGAAGPVGNNNQEDANRPAAELPAVAGEPGEPHDPAAPLADAERQQVADQGRENANQNAATNGGPAEEGRLGNDNDEAELGGQRANPRNLDDDAARPDPQSTTIRGITLECKICFTKTVDMVCLPCGHICMCRSCAPLVMRGSPPNRNPNICPICRRSVTGMVSRWRPD